MHLRGVGRRTTAAALAAILLSSSAGAAAATDVFGYSPTASPTTPDLDIDSWVDPAGALGLDEDELVPTPYFNFGKLHDSTVFAAGVDQMEVEDDPLPQAAERHLRVLQVRDTIAARVDNISVRIRRLRPHVIDLNDAIDHEHAEEARLLDEIDRLHRAIAEFAVRAFIGEEELDTALAAPGTDVSETRVLSDEVRETQFEGISDREIEHAERQAHRADLESQRRSLRQRIGDLQQERLTALAQHRELQSLARQTAASYQQTIHDRLTSMVVGTDIPLVAMNAYVIAERTLALEDPNCAIEWWMLAGVGRIESLHGHFGRSTLDADGNSTTPIRGPALDGRILSGAEFLTAGTPEPEPTAKTETIIVEAVPAQPAGGSDGAGDAVGADGEAVEEVEVKRLALIEDTDDGRLDNDAIYDRAVGPMQFIPQTWRQWEADVNGDEIANPQNIYDAAVASARYLCTAAGSMATESGQQRAYFAYNHDEVYSDAVTSAAARYRRSIEIPDQLMGSARPLGIASPENDALSRLIDRTSHELDLRGVPAW